MNQPHSLDAAFNLAGREVHVWTICIDSQDSLAAQLQRILSPDERRRAEQFRFKHLRESFIHARAALRILLGRYLRIPAASVGFEYSAKGKPGIAAPSRVKFNISHSDNLAVLAFTLDCEIGVDVERIRSIPEMMSIAKTILCPAEIEEWSALPAERREEAFFRRWTRKEACVKATGEGLSARLEGLRISPGWTLHDLALPSPFVGSMIYHDNRRPIRRAAILDRAQAHFSMELQRQIKAVIQTVSTRKNADPSPSEELFESGILDSFELPDLVSALEKEFGVSIPDSDLRPKNFSSVEQIEKYMESRR